MTASIYPKKLKKLNSVLSRQVGKSWHLHTKNPASEWRRMELIPYRRDAAGQRPLYEWAILGPKHQLYALCNQQFMAALTEHFPENDFDEPTSLKIREILIRSSNLAHQIGLQNSEEIQKFNTDILQAEEVNDFLLRVISYSGKIESYEIALSTKFFMSHIDHDQSAWKEFRRNEGSRLNLNALLHAQCTITSINLEKTEATELKVKKIILLNLETECPFKDIRLHVAAMTIHLRHINGNNFQIMKINDSEQDLEFNSTQVDPTNRTAWEIAKLKIDIRVASILVPLAQLTTYQTGEVIQLDDPVSGEVELVVNGVPIGTGELVDLEGTLAVEIKTLHVPQ